MSVETITRIFDKLDEQTKVLHTIDNKVTALDEKSTNYNERLKKIETVTSDYGKRLESVEKGITTLNCSCQNCQAKVAKIDELEAEVNKIKRDRWWIGTISAVVGWLVGILISLFK